MRFSDPRPARTVQGRSRFDLRTRVDRTDGPEDRQAEERRGEDPPHVHGAHRSMLTRRLSRKKSRIPPPTKPTTAARIQRRPA
jgi:hypothetical protein